MVEATTRNRDKRRMRGEESRKVILQSAIDSIAAFGLGSMTLDRVAERAGISRGLVVFHFKSKSKLLEAVLDFLGKQYEAGWNIVYQETSDSSMEKILSLIDYDIRFAYENPKYVSAWHAFWSEAKGNMLYHNISFPRDVNYEGQLEELIVEALEEQNGESAEAKMITMGLTAMMFGVWVESHLNPDPGDCAKYMQALRFYLNKCFPDLGID